jgi:hypothetical protein
LFGGLGDGDGGVRGDDDSREVEEEEAKVRYVSVDQHG